MLALMDDVQEETASRDGALHGQLRLTCSLSLTTAQLAAALSDFLDLSPRLKVDLNVSEGALNLVEARVDLAIRISDAPDAVLVARPLAPCASVLVASPAYLARCGLPSVCTVAFNSSHPRARLCNCFHGLYIALESSFLCAGALRATRFSALCCNFSISNGSISASRAASNRRRRSG